MQLKSRLKKFISEFGIPMTTLCQKIGLSRSTVYGWLNGQRVINDCSLERIETFLNKYSY